jgi:hypothetical protein
LPGSLADYAVLHPGRSLKASAAWRLARSFGPRVINVMQPATDAAGAGLLRALGYVELRHRVEMRRSPTTSPGHHVSTERPA